MIIHRMTACFGMLENRTLELQGGLNLLYAPNESGKSTWCAFIRVMLYGLSTAERERQGAKPDKIKYAPWSGLPMSGSMELSWQGREITLCRWTARANQPMQEFSATYTGTDEPVRGLTAESVGETLTGVPRAVFERSAFIRQGSLGVTNSAELEKRISSLATTGDENVSYTETDKHLRGWQRRRRSGKRGALPELEEQMAVTTETLRRLREASTSVLSLEVELAALEEEKQTAVRHMEETRASQRKAALEEMARSRRDLQSKLTERDKTAAALAEQDAALGVTVFANLTPDQAAAQVEDAKYRARELQKLAKRMLPMWLSWACLGIGAVLIALSAALGFSYPLMGAGLIFILLFVILYQRISSMRSFAAETMEDRRAILAHYSAEDEAGVDGALRVYESLWRGRSELSTRLTVLERELDAARERQQDADRDLVQTLDFTGGETEAARASRAVAELDRRIASLRERRAAAEGELRSMGDPMVLESELATLRERHKALTEQYEALSLAIETLAQTDEELRSLFSPLFSHRAAELFAALTDGRYDEVTLSKDLSAKARPAGTTLGYETDYLSEGAADQLYLAIRLAICELALDGDELCPMVIDDALVNFDEVRTLRALQLLEVIAQKRQVLLFTCHEKQSQFFISDGATRTLVE